MPVYNGERFVREALDSLLAQTFTDFELLISDNASTDGTEMICREYADRDPRIRFVRQVENIGALANFEFVMRQARGEYFMWAASDDLEASSDYLLELVAAIKRGSFGLAFPAVRSIYTGSDGTSRDLKRNAMDVFLNCRTTGDFCVKSIRMSVFQIYGLFRTSSLLENFWYIRRFDLWADHHFVQAFLANMPVCYVPTATKIYREHKNQISASFAPPTVLLSYVKYSLFTCRFWLREAKVPASTKLKVMTSFCYRHGRQTASFTLMTLRYFATRRSGRRAHRQE